MKKITLNETVSIPILGFGTWQMNGEPCQKAVASAINMGYRYIDTADAYNNHRDVAKGIATSGVEWSDKKYVLPPRFLMMIIAKLMLNRW